MPYPTPFIRLRINGVFGTPTGTEEWSTGCKIHLGAGTTDPTPFLEAVAPAVSAFFTSTALKSGSTTYLTELTGAVIGTDGKYVGGAAQATRIYTYPTPVSGNGTAIHDWAFACVLSLRTTVLGRGPGSHGRMYWPALAQLVATNDGRFTSSNTDSIRTAAVTLLQGINTAGNASFGSGSVVVNTSPVGSGVRAVVDRVLVGNRPDHIEKRENAVSEAYSVGTV